MSPDGIGNSAGVGHVSPSLAAAGVEGRAAFELKMPVDEATGAAIQSWAAERMAPDPHGDPDDGGSYRTTSLYLDTPELDVYNRTPGHRRRKFRIRRYGLTTLVYLERKTKGGERVSKRRTAIAESDVGTLQRPEGSEAWPGFWFHRRVLLRRLQPAALVTYRRTAFVGAAADGPVRLTLDREIRGVVTDRWSLVPPLATGSRAPRGQPVSPEWGCSLLPGVVVLELKFVDYLPAAFKELIATFRLNPGRVSKYRVCREAWSAARTSGANPGDRRA